MSTVILNEINWCKIISDLYFKELKTQDSRGSNLMHSTSSKLMTGVLSWCIVLGRIGLYLLMFTLLVELIGVT